MDKQKMLVGVAILMVAVVVVAVVFMISKSPVCDPVAEQPKVDEKSIKSIASKDLKALVRFAGYFKYLTESSDKESTSNKVFRPLETETVEYGQLNEYAWMSIGTDCAKINVTGRIYAQMFSAESLNVDFVVPNGKDTGCRSKIKDMVAKKGFHYKCDVPMRYECVNGAKKVLGEVVFDRLEYEIDGKPENVKKGKFTTEAEHCNEK